MCLRVLCERALGTKTRSEFFRVSGKVPNIWHQVFWIQESAGAALWASTVVVDSCVFTSLFVKMHFTTFEQQTFEGCLMESFVHLCRHGPVPPTSAKGWQAPLASYMVGEGARLGGLGVYLSDTKDQMANNASNEWQTMLLPSFACCLIT